MNYNIKSIYRNEFPEKLKNINKPPKKIYYKGNINLLFKESFGIVGTRKITDYGIKNCEYFTKEFVYRNIPIVSGMAIGTDSIAHKTTIENGGETIAVLGCGFDYIYPEENTDLFMNIIESGGLVITEYEKDIKPLKKNFPKRNRIISALSEGILIIEAAYRSGTRITANWAYKQGKKVFALPGRLDNYLGMGVNKLIKEGAILTTSIEDILIHYPQFSNKKCKERLKKAKIYKADKIDNAVKTYKTVEDKKDNKMIINTDFYTLYNLIKNGYSNLDEIFDQIKDSSEEDISNILEKLMSMELEGLIKKDILGGYKIIE